MGDAAMSKPKYDARKVNTVEDRGLYGSCYHDKWIQASDGVLIEVVDIHWNNDAIDRKVSIADLQKFVDNGAYKVLKYEYKDVDVLPPLVPVIKDGFPTYRTREEREE
jgi:hypothetical protein